MMCRNGFFFLFVPQAEGGGGRGAGSEHRGHIPQEVRVFGGPPIPLFNCTRRLISALKIRGHVILKVVRPVLSLT